MSSEEKGPCSHEPSSHHASGGPHGASVCRAGRQPGAGAGRTHRRVCNLLEGLVRSNCKDDFGIRGDSDTVVAAGLQDALRLSLSRGQTPFIHGPVRAAGNQFAVIRVPRD